MNLVLVVVQKVGIGLEMGEFRGLDFWEKFGRVTVGKKTMGSYEKCWVFIGMQKIASRLGFTVPRFCCNGHFFQNFYQIVPRF